MPRFPLLLLVILLALVACDKQPPTAAPPGPTQSSTTTPRGWAEVVDWYASLRDQERAALGPGQTFADKLDKARALDVHPRELSSSTWASPVKYDQPGGVELPHLSPARAICGLCFIKAISEFEAGRHDSAGAWLRSGTRILTELGSLPTVVERKAALDLCYEVTTFVVANPSVELKHEFAHAFATINRKSPFELEAAVAFMRDWYVRDIRQNPDSFKDTHGIEIADLKRNPELAAKSLDEALTAIANAWTDPNAPQLITDISRRYVSTPAGPFVGGLARLSRLSKDVADTLEKLSQSRPPN